MKTYELDSFSYLSFLSNTIEQDLTVFINDEYKYLEIFKNNLFKMGLDKNILWLILIRGLCTNQCNCFIDFCITSFCLAIILQ